MKTYQVYCESPSRETWEAMPLWFRALYAASALALDGLWAVCPSLARWIESR